MSDIHPTTAFRDGKGTEGRSEWVLAPRHPLPEMLGAFWRTKNTGTTEIGGKFQDDSDVAAYKAMIAAAPSPDRAGDGDLGEQTGASASPSGSHPSDQAPSDLGRPGFDPSRAWQDIASAPTDDRLILAGCPACEEFPDGRVMIWRASMLNRNKKGPTPHHLSFPATHWAPLLPAPAAGDRPESYRSEYRLAAWLVWFAKKQLDENCDWSARNRLRWAAEALIGEDAVLALGTEAGTAETFGLGPKDDGPACKATPKHSPEPNPPMSAEEAKGILAFETQRYNGKPRDAAAYLRWRADLVRDEPDTRSVLLARAKSIEAALRTLSENGEVR